jgi:hypothetical protein
MSVTTAGNQLVLAGNAYNNFTDTIKSKRTLEEYKHGIVRFMRFLKVSDVNNLTLLDAKEAQQKIIEYIGYLKQERQIAGVTINLYVASVLLCDSKQKKNRIMITIRRKNEQLHRRLGLD